jgi:PAS domain S-box-containing protein
MAAKKKTSVKVKERATIPGVSRDPQLILNGITNNDAFDIFSVDREYRYTFFNQRHAMTMKALFGSEICLGNSILTCISSDKDKKTMKSNIDRALSGESVTDGGYTGDHSLSRQYMEPSFNPVRDEGCNVIGAVVISRNGTEQKTAERMLRRSEERFRRLAENSQDIIFRLLLPDRKFEYVNPACRILTGHTPDEFYQNPALMLEIIHPDFRQRFTTQWEQLAKGDIPREYEYQIINTEGECRWFHQRNTIVRNNIGQIIALEGIVSDTTDRKRADISLKQIDERYRHISENTGDVIWLLDLENLRFTFISPSVTRLLGYTATEVMGMTLADILTPDALATVNKTIPATIAAIRAGDESARFQTHFLDQIRKDGSIISVEIVATLLINEGSGKLEVLGVSRDITDRKRAQDAIRESEEKFRSLVETTSDLVWEIDASGVYTYISPKVREMLGYDPEELIGRTSFEIMPPDEAAIMASEFRRFAENQLPVSAIINRCLRKDGTEVIMETSAVPLFKKDGTFIGYRGIDRDITQRKIAQNALEESEVRYRTFIQSANEAIFVIQEGKIPFCNKKGLVLFGRDPVHLATHSFLDLIHPDDRNAVLEKHERCIGSEKSAPLEKLRVMGADGELHWLEVNTVTVSWEGKPATLNFATDITEQKKADDLLRESERSYHGLFNTVGVAIYIQDVDGKFLNVNDGAVAMYGYPRDFFIGKTPEFLSAEGYNDLQELSGYNQRALNGEPQHFKFWGKRSNGEIFPKDVRLYKGSYFGKDVLIAVATDITEQKKAEVALQESEQHYHLLADNVNDVIWTADRDMNLTYISPSITALTGYTPAEFIQRRPEVCLTPDSLELLLRSRDEVLAHIANGHQEMSRPQILELEYLRKDNSVVCAEVVISLIHASDGQPHGVIGVTRDITDRKRAKEAIKESETYLKTILNSIQTGLVIIDPETHTIVDVNPTAEKMAGVNREKMIGSICHKFICPAEMGSCPVTDHGYSIDNSERTLITLKGPRSILKTVVPTIISGKKYLLESFIDITARKQAEERLAESEEKFHLIFKNSNDAIYLFEITPSGMPGRIVDANEVTRIQTGYEKDVILKKTFLEIHSHELPQKSRSIMMELLTKGQVRFETDVARKDGSRLPVEVSAQFAKLNQKTYVIAISRDISRRKREERALRIANQKLQLMNIVAWHDIQNKVTGLRGYVELSKNLVSDEQMKRFIRSEEEVLKVIHQQIQYTKEYQEIGVHPQEWINLHQTLRMILSFAELGNIQIIIEVRDLEIYCDPVIAKVFSHLMDNTKVHGKKATYIRISCREAGDGLVLVYEDNGVGISDEQKKDLFMRNVGTTSGFSLFFIHDILEVSEMTIRENGIPGEGVRFEIGIPQGIFRFGHGSD